MKYFVLFGDEDREEKEIYPYETRWFKEYEEAKRWQMMLPTCIECEIIGYDESTNAYEVIEMN